MGTSLSADLTLKYPITGIDDCARTASGQAAAVQPTSPMNSRRLMQLPQGRGLHRTISALGAVSLHHSKFGPPKTATGQPETIWLHLRTAASPRTAESRTARPALTSKDARTDHYPYGYSIPSARVRAAATEPPRPSCTILRLMLNSNFVACWTGRSTQVFRP